MADLLTDDELDLNEDERKKKQPDESIGPRIIAPQRDPYSGTSLVSRAGMNVGTVEHPESVGPPIAPSRYAGTERYGVDPYAGAAEHPSITGMTIAGAVPRGTTATPGLESAIAEAQPVSAGAMPEAIGSLIAPVSQPLAPRPAADRLAQLEAAPGNSMFSPAISRHHGLAGGLLRTADAIGSAIAPNRMVNIPGTTLHYEMRQLPEAERAAQLESTGALQAGQTQEAEALARKNANPVAKHIPKVIQGPNGEPMAAGYDPLTNQYINPDTQQPIPGAKEWEKPATPKEGETPLADRVSQVNKMLSSRYQVLHPGAALPPQYTIPPNATQKDYDRVDKALEAEERALGTKAQQDTTNEMRRQTMALANLKEKEGEGKTDLSTKEKVLTYFAPAQDADVRLKLMEDSQKSALKGDQQAMVNLLANHVAMTLGMPRGKVPRVSHEMFNEAQASAPWLARVEAHFDQDGYLTGVVLTPQQMQQMVDLGKQTRAAEWDAANSKADYIGVTQRPTSSYKEPTPEKTFTDADVQAAVAAHPGTNAKQIEDAFKAKGWNKK